jgi:YidC/Oxa1 family membrane protein insertase
MRSVKSAIDGRTSFFIVLCVLIIFTYDHLVFRKKAGGAVKLSPPTENRAVNSAKVSEKSEGIALIKQVPEIKTVLANGIISLTTPLVEVQISRQGGRLLSYNLKNYKSVKGGHESLNLITPHDNLQAEASLGFSQEDHTDVAVLYSGDLKREGDTQRVLLQGEWPNGKKVTKEYIFKDDTYEFQLNGRVSDISNEAPKGGALKLTFDHYLPNALSEVRLDPRVFMYLSEDGKLSKEPIGENALYKSLSGQKWVGFGDRYFFAANISTTTDNTFTIGSGKGHYQVTESNPKGVLQSRIYLGPKDTKYLSKVGVGLERSIDLGFFAFLAQPLLALLKIFNAWFSNFGLAIILLTLVIKLLFFPLTRASMKSMAAMQELQPEVKALQEKIKDPTQLNQEMMLLYKKKGVNPLGGCLPILVQIPVFFGLYSALLESIDLRHEPFALWINDLSAPESLSIFGVPVPLMIVIMGLTMVWQQWTQPAPSMDPAQKKIMMFMPVIFTGMFIFFPLPAGLVLYMLVNNLITIVQQAYSKEHKGTNPLYVMLGASFGIFGVGYLATLFPIST